MTIRNEIDIELWEAIQKNYDSENYTGAILDAVFRLTDTIRNKTGLEGDGVGLIGQAFGGDDPRIKLNKLQTDSEKDIQRGIQEILRGIYTGIRNPRSHDAMVDDKFSADSIIIFLNYLLKLIDQSKSRFSEKEFLSRVFDPYYVKSEEYSNLLVQDIPKRQRANIAIQTILNRHEGDIHALAYFLDALFEQLDTLELSRVYKVVSDELKTTILDVDIRYIIHICPAKYWKRIEPLVRMRIESILYEDFSKASYNAEKRQCGRHGALATWITTAHLENFENLEMWTLQTIKMIQSDDSNIVSYIEEYFWDSICYANQENITWPLEDYFRTGLEKSDAQVIQNLKRKIIWDKDHPWWTVFKDELKQYPDIKFEEFLEELPF